MIQWGKRDLLTVNRPSDSMSGTVPSPAKYKAMEQIGRKSNKMGREKGRIFTIFVGQIFYDFI